jgi:hypothetical protein
LACNFRKLKNGYFSIYRNITSFLGLVGYCICALIYKITHKSTKLVENAVLSEKPVPKVDTPNIKFINHKLIQCKECGKEISKKSYSMPTLRCKIQTYKRRYMGFTYMHNYIYLNYEVYR